MISRLLRYPYPAVLARAMASELARPSELEEMLSQPQDGGVPGDDLRPEQRLHLQFLLFGNRIARSLPPKGDELILSYLDRSETENLKLICRQVLAGQKDDLSALLMPVTRSRFSFKRLLGADTPTKLLDLMPKGKERRLIRESLAAPPERRLFRLETGLDRLFWENLRSHINRLSRFDRGAAEEILGKRADLDRYRVIRRGLVPGLSIEEILGALPDMGSAFPPSRVRAALESDEPEVRLKGFPLVGGLESPFTGEGEARILEKMRKDLWKILRSPPFDISGSLSALLLKELETRDLRAVLSGRRLSLDKNRVFPYLSHREA